jgi:hypothetical protein
MFSLQHLQLLPQLHQTAVEEDAAEIYAGVNHAIAADNRAGIDYRVAADLGSIADDCAEFSQAGGNLAVRYAQSNFGVIEFDVRENYACAKVRLIAQDGVVETLKTNTIGRILPIAVLPDSLLGSVLG